MAIVGLGCLFPKADGPRAFWANVRNKVDGITPVPPTHWDADDYFDADPKRPDMTYARRGGFLDPVPFAPSAFGIAPNDLEAIDTSQLLGLMVALQALQDAGMKSPPIATGKLDPKRTSVILGVTGTLELVVPLGARLGHPKWRKALAEAGVAPAVAEAVIRKIADGYVGWQENSFPGLLGNVVAGRIANRLDLGGTNCVVDAACASSLAALHLAGLELASGRCDAVVTGGVDTFNDIFMFMCFSKTPALSPTGDARPFDRDGDGTILGEGLGMMVLKRLADAERDGDRIYAVVKGLGSSSDGKGNAVYAPAAAGQREALKAAYRQANVTPDTIELVEAHGTGTKVGDATEVQALTEVFRDASPKRPAPWCALGSVKSQIGHTKAAAGAAGLIKAALALYHKVLPPTAKVRQPLEALASATTPFYLNAEKRPWLPRDAHPRRAGVSAFGFGGSNFHCVLEEYGRDAPGPDWDGDVQIVALSGVSVAALQQQLNEYERDKSTDGNKPTDCNRWAWERSRAAATRAAFRPDAACRLLLVIQRDATDLQKLIARTRQLLTERAGESSWSSPEGAYFGSGPAPGKLGVLFPGQGAQYVGMMRDLACTFPEVQRVLAEANRAFAAGLVSSDETRLSDHVYPPSAFTPAAKAAQDTTLRATPVAQPALGAVSLGALQVLARFGVTPDAAAGHSYGELTALCAAGCFDAPSLFALSQLRGRLMAERGDATTADAGAMLAVQAPLETVERVLHEDSLELVIANRNAPAQAVLSGRTAEVERAAQTLSARQVRHVRLPVAAAFHSPLVADAAGPFRAALEPIAFHTAQLPVFANTTASEYPRDPQAARDLLAAQLAQPVEFVQQITNMYQSGVRTFIEVGPGHTLTRLVESILENEPYQAAALDASAGQRSGLLDLAHLLAKLAARGHAVGLTAWDEGAPVLPPAPAKPVLTVPICGANYVKPRRAGSRERPVKERQSPAVENPRGAHATPLAVAPAVRPTPVPVGPKPMPSEPSRPSVPAPAALAQALQVTQDSLAAFQRLQEQTAQLHRQFLEGQEAAQRTLQVLADGQQRLLAASLGLPGVTSPSMAASPVPVAALPAPTIPAPVAERVAGAERRDAPALPPAPAPGLRQASAPATPTPALTAQDGSKVRDAVLAVVAEKTGYPPEMLDLDMGLDADLGIDSIKRVEILAALQERLPEAPAVKPEHLGTLHSLRQVADFLAGPGPPPTPIDPPLPGGRESDADRVRDAVLAVVAEKTGYPPEMLDLDMGLDADLGIDSIKRVEILSALQERLPDAPLVKPEHLGTLHTLADVADFLAAAPLVPAVSPSAPAPSPVRPSPPGLLFPSLTRQVVRPVALADTLRPPVSLPARAEVWLVGDLCLLASETADRLIAHGHRLHRFTWQESPPEPPATLAGLVLLAPTIADDTLPARAFHWLQRAGPALRRCSKAGGTTFVTVTQLDGAFGLADLDPHCDPVAGALAGLAKTARHEWPEVSCKALDLDPALPPAVAATAVADEVLCTGPAEVGVGPRGCITLELVDAPLASVPTRAFDSADAIIVSGGARGVTAEVAVALAATYRPTLVLLGRTPPPTAEPDWLAELTDEREIKRTLAARAAAGTTPRQLDAQFAAIRAGREVRRTLARITAAGGRAFYRVVDVRDAAAVAGILAAVRAEFGPITGVVHGAGVLADRRIEDKSPEQFAEVFDTKVAGLRALLAATADDPLKLLAVFSSSTGRFGRVGQADYAAANEALNKLAQQQARLRPACRVVALNWGPWAGGMVTPALEQVFAQEDIGLIPLADGARHLLAELGAADRAVEVVIGKGMESPKAHPLQRVGSAPEPAPTLMPAFERELTLAQYPVLRAHVLAGRAVLPMALTLEWFAHAALHGNPGLAFHGCDGLRILQPVTVGEDRATPVRVLVGRASRRDGLHFVPVELRGRRADGREIVHSRAEVVLATALPAAPPAAAEPALPPYPHGSDDIYNEFLFHGPELRGIEAVAGCGPAGIVVTANTAPAPAAWAQQPLRSSWIADPLVLDCAFQAMILWTRANRDAGSLPTLLGRYRQFRRSFPAGAVRVVCRAAPGNGAIVHAAIDFLDAAGQSVARIDDYECVLDPSLDATFRRNRLAEGAAP